MFSSFQFAKNQSNTSDLKLILVGPPPQAHETDSSIKEWIDYNNKDIISISDATEQTLQTLYQHAELLVFPSYIEGFGWPPLEAASIGCPVISSKTGAIDDLLGKNAIYIDPTNQDLINLTVSKLLAKKQRKKLKVCLPNNQKCQENYFELYQTLNG